MGQKNVFTGGLPPPRPPATFTGGLPAPQTPWRGAGSPPRPPAYREAPPLRLSVFSWYQGYWTWISRFPDFQTPPAAAVAVAEEFSDPNLTPLPTHPGIKYVARALAAINVANIFITCHTRYFGFEGFRGPNSKRCVLCKQNVLVRFCRYHTGTTS